MPSLSTKESKTKLRYNAEEEIKLIETTKEKIRGLQAELEFKQNLIMQEESENFEIFSDLVNHVGGETDLTINKNNLTLSQ